MPVTWQLDALRPRVWFQGFSGPKAAYLPITGMPGQRCIHDVIDTVVGFSGEKMDGKKLTKKLVESESWAIFFPNGKKWSSEFDSNHNESNSSPRSFVSVDFGIGIPLRRLACARPGM